MPKKKTKDSTFAMLLLGAIAAGLLGCGWDYQPPVMVEGAITSGDLRISDDGRSALYETRDVVSVGDVFLYRGMWFRVSAVYYDGAKMQAEEQ